MGDWVDPEIWYRQLPMFYAATAVLITDPAGRVLLVKPNYRNGWLIPGGYVEADEHPRDAAARELDEELGLQVPIGRLLLVDWAPPAGHRPRAIVNFVFDGGVLDEPGLIRVRTAELEQAEFFPQADTAARLPPAIAPRVPAALRSRAEGGCGYLFGAIA